MVPLQAEEECVHPTTKDPLGAALRRCHTAGVRESSESVGEESDRPLIADDREAGRTQRGLEVFRDRADAAGRGYQTMINEALREYLGRSREPVDADTIRRIVREELRKTG